jgi:predicted nucleotidyltransferase
VDDITNNNDGMAFLTNRDDTEWFSFLGRRKMLPPIDFSDMRQLMSTPYGMRSVSDLYESIDNCKRLHKVGKIVQEAARVHLRTPSSTSANDLRRALDDQDVALAQSTKVADWKKD